MSLSSLVNAPRRSRSPPAPLTFARRSPPPAVYREEDERRAYEREREREMIARDQEYENEMRRRDYELHRERERTRDLHHHERPDDRHRPYPPSEWFGESSRPQHSISPNRSSAPHYSSSRSPQRSNGGPSSYPLDSHKGKGRLLDPYEEERMERAYAQYRAKVFDDDPRPLNVSP